MKEFNLNQFLKCGGILSESPGRIWIGFGEPELKEGPGHFYAPNFFLEDEKPWWDFPHFSCVSLEFLLRELESVSVEKVKEEIDWDIPSKAEFQKHFDSLIPLFQNGILSKAVPAIFQEGCKKVEPMDLACFLKRALRSLQDWPQYVYGVWNNEGGLLGISPEILLQKSGSSARTMALAGTRGKDEGTNEPSLLTQKKDRREHELVVQGILLDLCRLEATDLSVGKMEELELKHLVHLKTEIHFQTLQTFEELISGLHPTAALGAYPRDAGKQWLKQHRSGDRFGAPFGISHDKESFCIVGIRNLQWDQKSVRVGAGCGVIPESVFEKEWAEIQRKLSSVRSVFGI